MFSKSTFYISEPYLESIPTVLILLACRFRNPSLFLGSQENFLGIPKTTMFWTTFSISVISGSFGMAKFLKLGPCQIVPSQKLHVGFFFLFITMGTTLVAKGWVLGSSLFYVVRESSETYDYVTAIMNWISICILPQFMLVSRKTNLNSPTLMTFLFDKYSNLTCFSKSR